MVNEPTLHRTTNELSCPVRPSPAALTYELLPDVSEAPFAVTCPVLGAEVLSQFFEAPQKTLVSGAAVSSELLSAIQSALTQPQVTRYDILSLTRDSVERQVTAALREKPIAGLDTRAEQALILDIVQDAHSFLDILTRDSVTLRIILDDSSGFESLCQLDYSRPADALRNEIKQKIDFLEYQASYLVHCDEDLVNQIKCYTTGGTLAVDARDIAPAANFDAWYEIFRGEGSLEQGLERAIASQSSEIAHAVVADIMERVWSYQREMPGFLTPGRIPYRLLTGAPHLYLGGVAELSTLGLPSIPTLWHAKPQVWSHAPETKRLLTIMDSPTDFTAEELVELASGSSPRLKP